MNLSIGPNSIRERRVVIMRSVAKNWMKWNVVAISALLLGAGFVSDSANAWGWNQYGFQPGFQGGINPWGVQPGFAQPGFPGALNGVNPYLFQPRPFVSAGPAIVGGTIPANPAQVNRAAVGGFGPRPFLGQHPIGVAHTGGGIFLPSSGALTIVPMGTRPGGIGADANIGLNLGYQYWQQSSQERNALRVLRSY
jgi:hypothetical protein